MPNHRLLKLVWEQLRRQQAKVVFAESCTAGLVAATLGKQPGISDHLCGSAVTYRESAKVNWLGVRESTLKRHSAVSPATTIEMVRGVLKITPEADWGVAITGHVGPNAPPDLDGIVYVAIAKRKGKSRSELLCCECYHLSERTRLRRRDEAAAIVIDLLLEVLTNNE